MVNRYRKLRSFFSSIAERGVNIRREDLRIAVKRYFAELRKDLGARNHFFELVFLSFRVMAVIVVASHASSATLIFCEYLEPQLSLSGVTIIRLSPTGVNDDLQGC